MLYIPPRGCGFIWLRIFTFRIIYGPYNMDSGERVCISIPNFLKRLLKYRDSAKNTSGISRRSWHFPKINWLPWQCPSINQKTRYRSIICTQSALIWWKDCKNRSSIGPILRYLTKYAIFCHVVKKYTNEPRFLLWSYWTKVHEIYTRYRSIICAVNVQIEVAMSHSVLDWQSDKCRA